MSHEKRTPPTPEKKPTPEIPLPRHADEVGADTPVAAATPDTYGGTVDGADAALFPAPTDSVTPDLPAAEIGAPVVTGPLAPDPFGNTLF